MSNARFKGADLADASLRGGDLRGALLLGASLFGAFSGTGDSGGTASGAMVDDRTQIDPSDLDALTPQEHAFLQSALDHRHSLMIL